MKFKVMQKKLLTIISLGVLFMGVPSANAVIARQGFTSYAQSDATTINIERRGDEFCHYFLTEDSVPVMADKYGCLRYVGISENGEIELSRFAASKTYKMIIK